MTGAPRWRVRERTTPPSGPSHAAPPRVKPLLHWLQSWGYVGLALGVLLESMGLPVPGETALLVAAFAAANGSLELPIVIAVAAGAGIVGDNLGYLLGRRLGREWIQRHGHRVFLPPERLAQVERFFDRFGAAAVALARFVTGVRVVAAFSAGVSKLPWRTFLPFNVLGAAAWATAIGLLGYAAGRGSAAFGLKPWMFGALVAGAVALVVVIAFLRRRFQGPLEEWLEQSGLGRLVWWELWILGLSVAGLVLFAKIAEDVTQSESRAFDDGVRHWLLAHHSAPLAHLATAVSWLGSTLVVVPLTVVVALLFWLRYRRTAPAAVLLAALLGSALFLGLKVAFQRGYPGAPPIGPAPHYSFPSGHATTITAAAVTTAYILVRQRLVRWVPAALAALLLALVVGLARVYLDHSRASDVIGGWAVGLFVSAVAGTVYEKLRRRSLHRDP